MDFGSDINDPQWMNIMTLVIPWPLFYHLHGFTVVSLIGGIAMKFGSEGSFRIVIILLIRKH